MPAGRPEAATGSNGGGGVGRGGATGAPRGNFRPPWVKDAPQPIPMPTAPWVHANRAKDVQSQPAQTDAAEPKAPTARKTSTVKIVPVQPAENGTTSRDPHTFQIPKLKEVPKSETVKQAPPKELQVPKLKETPKAETTKLQSREVKVPITLTTKPKDTPIQVHIESKKTQGPQDEPPRIQKQEVAQPVRVKQIQNEPELIDKVIPTQRNAILRQESMKKLTGPAPPPMPPPPPPPPVPEAPKLPSTLTPEQLEKIDQLRSRPRRRPDWGAMMKEVESGKKLKHVQCNDRSQPLLPHNKAKGQFIYESEKPNLHNQLLKQIQTGTLLKHVKTNDRSKPFLAGLRKFRRQMTIEEQIQKSQSIANMAEPEVEEEEDEMDDIDKIRDDLQSTKQMLALELRNKEAQMRENKLLQARILNLEAELERERTRRERDIGNTTTNNTVDEKVMQTLKDEAKEARKTAEELEKKYHETTDQLIVTKADMEEIKKQNQLLEKKLQTVMQGGDISKRQSLSERRDSEAVKEPKSDSESEVESESESESDECSNEEKALRRAEREVRLLRNKLRSYKNKEEAARRERKSLREQMRKNQHAIKVEKKKYKGLQREVNKMAALMRDEDEEEDEDDEEKEENEEEEAESEESETESESETSDEEEAQSESDGEDVPLETQKENLLTRSKRHENCLNALKKGNYMLKTNVDRLQDDLNKQKEEVLTLQEDLDSVLAELG